MDDKELLIGYFQQNGATTHGAREILEYLPEFFDDSHPDPSSYVSMCDFFAWLYIKHFIYSTPICNLGKLKHHVAEEFEDCNKSYRHTIFNGLRRRVDLYLNLNDNICCSLM